MKNQFKVKKTVPITVIDCEEHGISENQSKCRKISGTICNLQFTWVACGAHLYVLDTWTGSRVAAYTFHDVAQRGSYTRIICVEALSSSISTTPLLAVGLEHNGLQGILAIFDIVGSRVLKFISLPNKISSLCVVSAGGVIDETSIVLGMLRTLDGILAIGTVGGDILLLDICQEQWKEQPHLGIHTNISKLYLQNCADLNLGVLEMYKAESLQRNQHLALVLNGDSSAESFFTLWTTNGEGAFRESNRMRIRVSALHYVPQLVALLVGYNFGAWQIYNLLTMELEYTSAVYEEFVPVSHFAYQEPSDDPRAFCYVWAVYSDQRQIEPSVPLAAMYALSYESKETLQGYGIFYQKFTSCSLRYQMDLMPASGPTSLNGGHCVTIQSYVGAPGNQAYDASGGSEQSLALCMLVWVSWPMDSDHPETVMGLFDLDQWYKEQMPDYLRPDNNDSFIGIYSLSNIVPQSCEPILDVKINPVSLTLFSAVQRLEEHYYPSALAFDFVCISPNMFTSVSNIGIQRYLLSELETGGPDLFIFPEDMALACQSAGLVPLFCSTETSLTAHDSNQMKIHRECLLSLALEHGALILLTKSACQWASGSHASVNCTLGMFVEWAVQCAESLQKKATELCTPLFDYSNTGLDTNARHVLDQCVLHLHNLAVVFKRISKSCDNYLNDDAKMEIEDQLRALQMSSTHLDVLQWLLNVGLLPESFSDICDGEVDASGHIRAPYPAENLTQYYTQRREELNSCLPMEKRKCSMLFIDNLIEYECRGDNLLKQWTIANGVSGNSSYNTNEIQLYPPRSLQAVLRTYLVDDVELHHKHSVLVYLFLDLAMSLDQSRFSSIITHLIKFPAVFKLSSSLIKMIQAFWQLDHGDFNTAMEQLLDPMIGAGQNDIRSWQHQMILQTLLVQNQHKYALLYLQMRQPPLKDIIDIADMIQLLLANNLLHSAFMFQKQHRSNENTERVLEEFFTGCYNVNLATSAMKLALCPDEENVFVEMLKELKSDKSFDKIDERFEVLYYLQHGRIFEALEMDTNIQKIKTSGDKQGLDGQRDGSTYSKLLHMSMNTIPSVMRTLFELCKNKKIYHWSQFDRPAPLSVIVDKKETLEAQYKSNLIAESLNKVHEIWTQLPGKFLNKVSPKTVKEKIDAIPFLCTPKRVPFTSRYSSTPVVFPKIINQSNQQSNKSMIENYHNRSLFNDDKPWEESTAKKRKIETGEAVPMKFTAPEKLLLTPIVKRKIPKQLQDRNESSMLQSDATPQSILKVRQSYLSNEEDINVDSQVTNTKSKDNIHKILDYEIPEIDNKVEFQSEERLTCSSVLGATPRKALSKTSRTSVRFEEPKIKSTYENKKNESIAEFNINSILSEESFTENMSDLMHSSDEEIINAEKVPEKLSVSKFHISNVSFKPERSFRKTVSSTITSFVKETTSISESSLKPCVVIEDESKKLQSPYIHIKGRKSLRKVALENTHEKNSSTPIASTSTLAFTNSPIKITPIKQAYSLRSSKRLSEQRLSEVGCESENVSNVPMVNKNISMCENKSTFHDAELTNDSEKLLDDSNVNFSFIKKNFGINLEKNKKSQVSHISISDNEMISESIYLDKNVDPKKTDNDVTDNANKMSQILSKPCVSISEDESISESKCIDENVDTKENNSDLINDKISEILNESCISISEDESISKSKDAVDKHIADNNPELIKDENNKMSEMLNESHISISEDESVSESKNINEEIINRKDVISSFSYVFSNNPDLMHEDESSKMRYAEQNISRNIDMTVNMETSSKHDEMDDSEREESAREHNIEDVFEEQIINMNSMQDNVGEEILENYDPVQISESIEVSQQMFEDYASNLIYKNDNFNNIIQESLSNINILENETDSEKNSNASNDQVEIKSVNQVNRENSSRDNQIETNDGNKQEPLNETIISDPEKDLLINAKKCLSNKKDKIIDECNINISKVNTPENIKPKRTRKSSSVSNFSVTVEKEVPKRITRRTASVTSDIIDINIGGALNVSLTTDTDKPKRITRRTASVTSDITDKNISEAPGCSSVSNKPKRITRRTASITSDIIDKNSITDVSKTKQNSQIDEKVTEESDVTENLITKKVSKRRGSHTSDTVAKSTLIVESQQEQIPERILRHSQNAENLMKDVNKRHIDSEQSSPTEKVSKRRNSQTSECLSDSVKQRSKRFRNTFSPSTAEYCTPGTSTQQIDMYSSSRRMTRNQKMLLQSMQTEPKHESDSESDDDDVFKSHRGPDIVEMDPILLLDKKDFKGPVDPEESKIFEHSPTSSIQSSMSLKSVNQNTKEASISGSPAHNTRSHKMENANDSTAASPPKPATKKHSSPEQSSMPVRRSSRKSSKNMTPERDTRDGGSDTASIISVESNPSLTHNRLTEESADIRQSSRIRNKIIQSDNESTLHKRKSTRQSVLPTKLTLTCISEEESGKLQSKSEQDDMLPPIRRTRKARSTSDIIKPYKMDHRISQPVILLNPINEEDEKLSKRHKTVERRPSNPFDRQRKVFRMSASSSKSKN